MHTFNLANCVHACMYTRTRACVCVCDCVRPCASSCVFSCPSLCLSVYPCKRRGWVCLFFWLFVCLCVCAYVLIAWVGLMLVPLSIRVGVALASYVVVCFKCVCRRWLAISRLHSYLCWICGMHVSWLANCWLVGSWWCWLQIGVVAEWLYLALHACMSCVPWSALLLLYVVDFTHHKANIRYHKTVMSVKAAKLVYRADIALQFVKDWFKWWEGLWLL